MNGTEGDLFLCRNKKNTNIRKRTEFILKPMQRTRHVLYIYFQTPCSTYTSVVFGLGKYWLSNTYCANVNVCFKLCKQKHHAAYNCRLEFNDLRDDENKIIVEKRLLP